MCSSLEEYTNLQCFLPFYHLDNISFQLTLQGVSKKNETQIQQGVSHYMLNLMI